jgi:hypothetical protein
MTHDNFNSPIAGAGLTTIRVVGAALALLVGSAPTFAAEPVSKAGVTLVPTNEPDTFAYSKPAPDFDPVSASDRELELAGFPPRPDPLKAPEAHKHWKKMVTAPQLRVEQPDLQRSAVENRPASNVKNFAAAPPAAGNSVYSYSGNWSGFAVYAPYGTFSRNDAFTVSEFIVPAVQQAWGVCNGTWDYSSIWTGFDGWGSGDVLQAGIEADAYCSNGIFGQSKSTFYSAWYEWYPAGSVRIGNVAVNPGDLLDVEVWYTTSAPNGHAYIINYDTQQSVSLAFNIPGGTVYAGNSVEWIVEAPTVSGSLATLSNYIATAANYNYAYSGGYYFYPGSGPAGTTSYDITMKPGSIPLSYCLLTGTYALWCQDEGTAY